MALILEREALSRGLPKIVVERYRFAKKNTTASPEEDSLMINHNLAIPISHLPRSSQALIQEAHLRTSRRLPSEYVLPVLISITRTMTHVINKIGDTPVVVASFSHAALGTLQPLEEKPGIPLVIFNKSHQEFMGRLMEETSYKDPPIRFGNHIFRRSQFSSTE